MDSVLSIHGPDPASGPNMALVLAWAPSGHVERVGGNPATTQLHGGKRAWLAQPSPVCGGRVAQFSGERRCDLAPQ